MSFIALTSDQINPMLSAHLYRESSHKHQRCLSILKQLHDKIIHCCYPYLNSFNVKSSQQLSYFRYLFPKKITK